MRIAYFRGTAFNQRKSPEQSFDKGPHVHGSHERTLVPRWERSSVAGAVHRFMGTPSGQVLSVLPGERRAVELTTREAHRQPDSCAAHLDGSQHAACASGGGPGDGGRGAQRGGLGGGGRGVGQPAQGPLGGRVRAPHPAVQGRVPAQQHGWLPEGRPAGPGPGGVRPGAPRRGRQRPR